LKILIKDSNLVVARTKKQQTKDGKYRDLAELSTLLKETLNLCSDLVAVVLAAPAHQQPSSDSIASIIEQVSFRHWWGKYTEDFYLAQG
jgi:hypothetical protein